MVAAVLSEESFSRGALAFFADSNTLAVDAGADQIRLWDVSDPFRTRSRVTLTQSGAIKALAFAHNGHTLISAADEVVAGRGPLSTGQLSIFWMWAALRAARRALLAAQGVCWSVGREAPMAVVWRFGS